MNKITGEFFHQCIFVNSYPTHFSTLGATRLVEKVSIDQLTLAGLSTNISVDGPVDF